MNHRTLGALIWAASLVTATACGLLFAVTQHVSLGKGVYWAIATVTTVGYGDVTPHTAVGYVIASATMLLAVPLWATSFSLVTSFLVGQHVHQAKLDIKKHISSIHGGNK